MTVDEAHELFKAVPSIREKMETLKITPVAEAQAESFAKHGVDMKTETLVKAFADMGGDIDKDENVVNLETRHYRNSRYMLGALDFVQAISMVSDNVNKLPKLNVNQKLIDRSYSYFTEAAELNLLIGPQNPARENWRKC